MSETNDSSNWHQDFIASNLLVIGYNAWAGHLSQKRGAIVCSTNSPTTEVVLLLESCDGATFFYLKNLPVIPPQCYEQVRKTWDEFQPGVRAGQDEQANSQLCPPVY